MIKRADYIKNRTFPHVSRDIYESGQDLSSDILGLANTKFSLLEKIGAVKLDANGHFGKLLYHHKMALEAETAQKFQRADFFWYQFYSILKKIYSTPIILENFYDEIKDTDEVKLLDDPNAFFQCLINELFIDTHCAFYNDIIDKKEEITTKSRALIHIDHITYLFELSNISKDEQKKLLDPFYKKSLESYQNCGKLNKAIQLYEQATQRFPDTIEYQNELCNLYFSQTFSQLSEKSSDKNDNIKDAQIINDGIEKLKGLNQKFPHNFFCYQLIGEACHIRSVKLANGELLSAAILEIEKAVTFNPFSSNAQKTKDQLIEMMKELQSQMEVISAQIANEPGKTLNQDGQKMMEQATRGFTPVNTFIESDEAKQIKEGFYSAYAKNTWLSIGFKEPDTDWDQKAKSLIDAVNTLFESPPENEFQTESVWEELASKIPSLSNLDSQLVCSFLNSCLFSIDDVIEVTHTDKIRSDMGYPIIKTARSDKISNNEPFSYWLLSRRDFRIKAQIIIATALLIFAGVSSVKDSTNLKSRNTAYEEIMTASANNNFFKIIEQSEIFLSHDPLSGRDVREPIVVDLYNEAIVRWIIMEKVQLDKKAKDHVQRYKKFINNSKIEV